MELFSQIMPLNSSLNEYAGFLTVMNEEFYIHLLIQNGKASKKVTLRGCKKLFNVLEPEIKTLEKHLNQCSTAVDMLREIHNQLECLMNTVGLNKQGTLSTEYSILFEQLQDCGWDKVQYVSPDFDVINLITIDDMNREHILKVWIPEKFPNEILRYECDMPQEFTYKWLPGDTLSNLFAAFQEKVNMFIEFWNNMDEIDNQTWVIEPENPNRKECKRRIALASGVSLLLVINPLLPTSIPTCNYLGPERIVEPIREKFNKNIRLWSEYDSLLTNLRQVLEVEFPSPTTAAKEEFCLECGICYSHLYNNAVPEINCDNSNCNQAFHRECLYEYIRMLPDVRSSFNKLFGKCPYCETPLWCMIP
ncbi:E3 ubiquitin-protein ligase FANCL [Parasteatoda tepidariorum]|nr:E3 ubiquitin-protein ligase FANCL [Parasteatoda tepidariorum]